MKRQAFVGIEADDEFLVLPGNLIALDNKARTVRMGDLHWFYVLTLVGDSISGVAASTRRKGQWPYSLTRITCIVQRHGRLHARDVIPRFHDTPIGRHNALVARV